jgi:hypothetical protein
MRTRAIFPRPFVFASVIASSSEAVMGACPWMICAPRMSSTIPATWVAIASASLRPIARWRRMLTSAVSRRPSSVREETLRVTESVFCCENMNCGLDQ